MLWYVGVCCTGRDEIARVPPCRCHAVQIALCARHEKGWFCLCVGDAQDSVLNQRVRVTWLLVCCDNYLSAAQIAYMGSLCRFQERS